MRRFHKPAVFFALCLSIIGRGSGAWAETMPGQASPPNLGVQHPTGGDYCSRAAEMEPSKSCSVRQEIVEFDFAANYINNCPQRCEEVSVISREEWGASPAPPHCEKEDALKHAKVDRLKQERGRARCARDKKRAQKLKAQIEGLESPNCLAVLQKPTKLVVHHTTDDARGGVHKISPKVLQKVHKRKWLDIGYHFVIAMDENHKWQVYEGRERIKGSKCSFVQGAHGGPGLNNDSLGIVVAGDYEKTSQPSFANAEGEPKIPLQAIQKLVQLVASLKKDCPSLTAIQAHGDCQKDGWGCSQTKCPGSGCRHLINNLQAIVGP